MHSLPKMSVKAVSKVVLSEFVEKYHSGCNYFDQLNMITIPLRQPFSGEYTIFIY
jgi:hypothetical protein